MTASEPFSHLARELGRAAGGALLFSLPMLMTMEMWWLGFIMDRERLLLLVLVNAVILFVLSRHVGFEKTSSRSEDLRDAAIAWGVGIVTSVLVLLLFGVIGPGMSSDEIVGKVVLQSVSASLGALLARGQLGGSEDDGEDTDDDDSYSGELFLMVVGALFLGFNVAPTEEMVLISYQMTPWHALALVFASLACMHGFVYAVGFHGGVETSEHLTGTQAFLRFTLPGYVIALLVSLYVLWTFGRMDDNGATQVVMTMVVLGFPSAVGAAAARLIL